MLEHKDELFTRCVLCTSIRFNITSMGIYWLKMNSLLKLLRWLVAG